MVTEHAHLHLPPEPWIVDTWRLIINHDFAEASENISQALVKNPNDAEAHNVKGYLLSQKGSYSEATEHYKRALDCNPKNGRLHAYILNNLRRSKEGLSVIDAYLDENPDDDYGWDAKGLLQSQLKVHALAIQSFARALEINPLNRLAREHKLVLSNELKRAYQIISCWTCSTQFQGEGLEPIPYWDIPFNLCLDCYRKYLAATKTRHVICIEKLQHYSSATEGVLLAFSLGNKHKFVFEPTKKDILPVVIERDVTGCQAVDKGPASEGFIPISPSEADAGRYIQLDYMVDGRPQSLIFELNKEYRLMLMFMQGVAAELRTRS